MTQLYGTSDVETEQVQSIWGTGFPSMIDLPSAGPETSNTGPSSSQNPPQRTTGGVDWCELSVYGAWSLSQWEALRTMLAERAMASQEAGEVVSLSLDHHSVGVKPRGVGQGIRCKWAMEWKGCTIGIVDQRLGIDQHPNVRIFIPSNPCMVTGADQLVDDLRGLLAELGFQWERATVSREDYAVDLVGVLVEEFQQAMNTGRIVCRATRWTCYGEGERSTGFFARQGERDAPRV